MDEDLRSLLVFFGAAFALSAAAAAVCHARVRDYLNASLLSAFVATLVGGAIYGMWRGYVPHPLWFLFFGLLAFVIALAVGIPFYRRRTGHGLGEDWRP